MEADIRPMESTSGAMDGIAESVAGIWMRLRAHLERRSTELNAEVRGYPTPIARCDDQLPKLLEQRARAVRLLKIAVELDSLPARPAEDAWLDRARQFLSGPDAATDDDIEAMLRSRLSAALARLPRQADKA